MHRRQKRKYKRQAQRGSNEMGQCTKWGKFGDVCPNPQQTLKARHCCCSVVGVPQALQAWTKNRLQGDGRAIKAAHTDVVCGGRSARRQQAMLSSLWRAKRPSGTTRTSWRHNTRMRGDV